MSSEDDYYSGDVIPGVDSKSKGISRAKLDRMRHRNNRKRFLIYPEDQPKVFWDLFITTVLLVSCLLTPFNLAFGELNNDPLEWIIINYTIDICFLIDIIIIFNSAFYDNEFIVVEDRKIIAKEYLRSWFIIDLLAIIPFDLLISTQDQNYGDIARIVRLGRISKLIKMTRLLRKMQRKMIRPLTKKKPRTQRKTRKKKLPPQRRKKKLPRSETD